MAESVLLRYCEAAIRIVLSDCRLAAQGVQNRGVIPSVSIRMCMANNVGALKGRSHLRDRLVNLADNPKHPRLEDQNGDSSILAGCPSRRPVCLIHGAE